MEALLATQLHLRRIETQNAQSDDLSSRTRRERSTPPRPPVRPRRGWYMPLKHTADLLLAVALSLIALPLVALAALAVKLTSSGPVFYSQVRVGRNSRLFRIYKIRTMVDNCESLTGP